MLRKENLAKVKNSKKFTGMESFKLVGSNTDKNTLHYDYLAIVIICGLGALIMLVTLGSSI